MRLYPAWLHARFAAVLGTEIVVTGFRAKDGSNRGVGKDLTFIDGKRLFMGGSAPGADGDSEK